MSYPLDPTELLISFAMAALAAAEADAKECTQFPVSIQDATSCSRWLLDRTTLYFALNGDPYPGPEAPSVSIHGLTCS